MVSRASPQNEMIRLIEAGVRPILATGAEYRETRRVLIAFSGSVESARAMRDFANFNLWPGVTTRVVHFGTEKEGEVLLPSARSYLEDHGFDAEVELVSGSAKKQLLPYAQEWDADLIVLGNSAKSLLRRRIFGETALNTIRESPLTLFLS